MRTKPEPADRCPIRFEPSQRAWLVSDLELARAVLGDSRRFSLDAYMALGPDLSDVHRFLLASPDRHRLLRKAMTRAFGSSRVRQLDRGMLRVSAEALVASLPRAGTVNLQAAYVAPYTSRVFYGLIGLSKETGDALVAAYRVAHQLQLDPLDSHKARAAFTVLRQQAARAVVSPDAPSGTSGLLDLAREERWLDRDLTVEDLVCLIMSLVEAVAVKTHRDLTATLLRRVAAISPVDQELLRRTEAFDQAADEALRLQQGGLLPRTTVAPARLGPVRLSPGDRVLVDLGDIGTDPNAFARSEDFDPWRPDLSNAISFGVGAHRCPGKNVAKAIATRACRSLLEARQLRLVAETPMSFTVELQPWPN